MGFLGFNLCKNENEKTFKVIIHTKEEDYYYILKESQVKFLTNLMEKGLIKCEHYEIEQNDFDKWETV